jgi:hypothetical protein
MKTKKQILAYFKEEISQVSYNIQYYNYKNEDSAKLNSTKSMKKIIDICKNIGIEEDLVLTWINEGEINLIKDIN